jgi:hypothetical protein
MRLLDEGEVNVGMRFQVAGERRGAASRRADDRGKSRSDLRFRPCHKHSPAGAIADKFHLWQKLSAFVIQPGTSILLDLSSA